MQKQKSFLVLILVLTLLVAMGLVEGAESRVTTDINPILGTWMLGMVSGAEFDLETGQYLGGATGMGQLYLFRNGGTYRTLVIWMDTMYFESNYTINDDVLKLTKRVVRESKDRGNTWSEPEALPDATALFPIRKR